MRTLFEEMLASRASQLPAGRHSWTAGLRFRLRRKLTPAIVMAPALKAPWALALAFAGKAFGFLGFKWLLESRAPENPYKPNPPYNEAQ